MIDDTAMENDGMTAVLLDQTRAEIQAYRKMVEMSRVRAHQEAVALYTLVPHGDERVLRERAIWAQHTLRTVDLSLAILTLTEQLAQYSSLTPMSIVRTSNLLDH